VVITPKSVAIIGQGYVGLPLAMAACRAGWSVTGIDVSKSIVLALSAGVSHVEDVSNVELRDALDKGIYQVSTSGELVSKSEIAIICVPTPLDEKGLPDLSYLESAVRLVANHLPEQALLISESTSYPGTVRDFVAPLVASLRGDRGIGISYASAPERVDPRNAKWRMENTPRLVSGIDQVSTQRALDFYRSVCESVIEVSKPEVAEMAKLLENTFRQVNIALINQLVPLCKELEIDIREVVEAAGSKPYGYMKFFPGAGVGGHCIPIDPLYLLWKARQVGIELPFVKEADEINGAMPDYVSSRLIDLAKPVPGSYIRESPAEDVARSLESQGFKVLWSDPLVKSFHNYQKLTDQNLAGAIVVTAQVGLAVAEIAKSGVPILDCTGAYKAVKGIEQL
jgi:UDP-N-acetyl-D-glucosamine dehydrogenase